MRNITKIIDQVRRQTENEEVSEFTGIQDSEFIQYLNDAQYHLQAAIVHNHPNVFIAEKIIDAVSDQEKYDLPSDCFLGNKVHNVEYSTSGSEEDFYVLQQDTLKSRASGITGYPARYIRRSGHILLAPEPQSGGKIRINYVKRLKELTTRKGKVSTEGTSSTSANFTINLDNSTFNTDFDAIDGAEFYSIVDSKGNILLENIERVNSDINTITCKPTSTAVTIPAGSFIVDGENTSSHSELDISVERFLIAYAAWKILKRDSSVDSSEAMAELQLMQQEIVKSYALITDDVTFIPQLNSWDDWSL
tara:strand:+ start:8249 stop:9166 length:918 start_codon:yes stop_codon:yes gene_type:complete